MENKMKKDRNTAIIIISMILSFISGTVCSAWKFAASLGWIPPTSGYSWSPHVASMFPSESTIPIPVFSAVPSIPKQIIK